MAGQVKLSEEARKALAVVHVQRALERFRADRDVAAEVYFRENWPGGTVAWLAKSAFDQAWDESADDRAPFTLAQAKSAARVLKVEADKVAEAAAVELFPEEFE